MSGAKPSRYLALPAAASVASVRPWNEPWKVMIRLRSGWPLHELVAPRGLDRALAGLRAGVAEEHPVGERRRDQPLGQPLLPGDPVEVGGVPDLVRLLGQRRDQRAGAHGPAH